MFMYAAGGNKALARIVSESAPKDYWHHKGIALGPIGAAAQNRRGIRLFIQRDKCR